MEPTADSVQKSPEDAEASLILKIKDLLQFYFGDSNLLKDRFMKQKITSSPQGYVDLSLIASFNKMRSLTTNVELIRRAAKASSLLQVSSDGLKIRRQKALPQISDVDHRTVYAEHFPPGSNHDSLTQLFGKCGKVTYVSLPRFESGEIKDFGFIEFDSSDSARRAIETFNGYVAAPAAPATVGNDQPPAAQSSTSVEGEKQQGDEMVVEGVASSTNVKPMKVISKSRWDELKREYKKLQRKFLVQALQEAGMEPFNAPYYQNQQGAVTTKPQHGVHVVTYTKPGFETQKQTASTAAQPSTAAAPAALPPAPVVKPIEFTPGVILKLEGLPSEDPQTPKNTIKERFESIASVAYIDYPQGSKIAHVRFHLPEAVSSILETFKSEVEISGNKINLSLLQGDEEQEYWKKVEEAKIAYTQQRAEEKRKKAEEKAKLQQQQSRRGGRGGAAVAVGGRQQQNPREVGKQSANAMTVGEFGGAIPKRKFKGRGIPQKGSEHVKFDNSSDSEDSDNSSEEEKKQQKKKVVKNAPGKMQKGAGAAAANKPKPAPVKPVHVKFGSSSSDESSSSDSSESESEPQAPKQASVDTAAPMESADTEKVVGVKRKLEETSEEGNKESKDSVDVPPEKRAKND